MEHVLIAGATGYLGKFVAQELKDRQYFTRVITRNIEKFQKENIAADEVIKAEVTQPETLKNCCRNIDIVFSSIGITKQKDGLTYMDVDYQANLHLLNEAKRSGVRKFIYVSVLHGAELTQLKICSAKEKFVQALKSSGIDYCIIRPTGYFSDMGDFLTMAQKGRVYLIGNGRHTMNPVAGEDLAKVCVDAIQAEDKQIEVGGPDILAHNQIAGTALLVAGKKIKITHVPLWIIKLILGLLRTFTNSKIYGPVEFFITVLSMDMVAPQYGRYHLKAYFERLEYPNKKPDIVEK